MFKIKCLLAMNLGYLFALLVVHDVSLTRLVPMGFVRWVRRTLRERRIYMKSYEIPTN